MGSVIDRHGIVDDGSLNDSDQEPPFWNLVLVRLVVVDIWGFVLFAHEVSVGSR